MTAILEARELVKKFGDVVAVDGVSFAVPAGICFGLLGPNGAGKTTTVEVMEGMLLPTAGLALYKGEPIGARLREAAR